jgi:hypothetical protein
MKRPLLALMLLLAVLPAQAEEKSWNAAGDQANWFDDLNWYPSPAPARGDRAKLDSANASAIITQSFDVGAITVGGKKSSALAIGNFVQGAVEPGDPTEVALDNRRDGTVTLKGSAGRTVLKGSYKSSKSKMDEEPSFLFFVE